MAKLTKDGFFSAVIKCDHKAIGTLYVLFAIICGIIGAVLSILLRLGLDGVLFSSLNNFGSDNLSMLSVFNIAHALIFVFFTVMPALVGGFSNWLVPLMIGTQNVAFPKLNMLAFVLLPLSLILSFCGFFFVDTPSTLKIVLLIGIYVCATSYLLSFVNFITTILTMRAPFLSLIRLPIFVWSILLSSFMGIMVVPAMLAALTQFVLYGEMLNDDVSILIWFFSHPEIYVLLLLAFGIIGQIISTFCQARLWLQNGVIAAMFAILVGGFVLWSHNLFNMPKEQMMTAYFYSALPILALPIGFILLSFCMTIWQNRANCKNMPLKAPFLWVMAFIFTVFLGLVSALQLVFAMDFNSVDVSAFVGHFHYILALSAIFSIFAAWYYWLPKMSGYAYRNFTTKLQFWLMFGGVNAIFLPQHFNQFIPILTEGKAYIGIISTLGALLVFLSIVVFIYGFIEIFVRRIKVENNPWGRGATSLEWQLPSPPKEAWYHVPHILR